jgi:hypothetical protein
MPSVRHRSSARVVISSAVHSLLRRPAANPAMVASSGSANVIARGTPMPLASIPSWARTRRRDTLIGPSRAIALPATSSARQRHT